MAGYPFLRSPQGAPPDRVVVFAVTFLRYAAEAADALFIAGLGIAISRVIIACGYIINIHSKANIERKRLEIQGSDQKNNGSR